MPHHRSWQTGGERNCGESERDASLKCTAWSSLWGSWRKCSHVSAQAVKCYGNRGWVGGRGPRFQKLALTVYNNRYWASWITAGNAMSPILPAYAAAALSQPNNCRQCNFSDLAGSCCTEPVGLLLATWLLWFYWLMLQLHRASWITAGNVTSLILLAYAAAALSQLNNCGQCNCSDFAGLCCSCTEPAE